MNVLETSKLYAAASAHGAYVEMMSRFMEGLGDPEVLRQAYEDVVKKSDELRGVAPSHIIRLLNGQPTMRQRMFHLALCNFYRFVACTKMAEQY